MTDKWKKDRERFQQQLPSRWLSTVCAIIGTVHFAKENWKADSVLLGFVTLGFLPWMGYVFESLGKDGAKFRNPKQGEDVPPPTTTTTTTTKRPPAGSRFSSLSWQEKKVLATLWKYQTKQFPGISFPRWTFVVNPLDAEFVVFSRGFADLCQKGFATAARNNGYAVLTQTGFDMCKENGEEILAYTNTYDNFGN